MIFDEQIGISYRFFYYYYFCFVLFFLFFLFLFVCLFVCLFVFCFLFCFVCGFVCGGVGVWVCVCVCLIVLFCFLCLFKTDSGIFSKCPEFTSVTTLGLPSSLYHGINFFLKLKKLYFIICKKNHVKQLIKLK